MDAPSTPDERRMEDVADSRAKVVATSNCQGCYQRKTKCDRRIEGCSNCAKLSAVCVYPSHKIPTSHKRGPYNKDLVRKNLELEKKLATLEATIQRLNSSAHGTSEATQGLPTTQSGKPITPESEQSTSGVQEDVGGILANGRSVTGDFGDDFLLPSISWDKFGTKFGDNDLNLRREQENQPLSGNANEENESVLPRSDTSYRELHPNPQELLEYWLIFKEKIQPLLMILHVPTAESLLFEINETMDEINPCMDVLKFSICHAAIVDTPPSDLGSLESRERQLYKYSCAIKRILEEPEVLASSDIIPLQALVIYLYHNRTDDEHTRYSLVGKALRMAQFLGIHRDGAILHKPPFETEMQRRLWWNIHRLERRLAENYLEFPFSSEPQFDTLLPTNVNDADIAPIDAEYQKPRVGRTEMSFCLVDFEISSLTFKLLRQRPSVGTGFHERKASMVRESLKKLTEEHLKFCDPANDFDLMITTFAKLCLSRIWLLAHQPTRHCIDYKFQRPLLMDGTGKNSQIRNLLPVALETYEYGSCLLVEPRISKWSWIFKLPNHIIIHLEFYLLLEICYHPLDALVPRTWRSLDEHSSKGYSIDVTKAGLGQFQVILNKFRSQARALRDKETRTGVNYVLSSGEPQPIFEDQSAAGRGGPNSMTWIDSNKPFLPTNPMAVSPPLISQPPDSNFSGHITTDEMQFQHSSFRDAAGTNNMETDPPHNYSSTTLFGSNLESLGVLPSSTTQNLHDTDLGGSTWFQFQDGTMGPLMDEYTDALWDNLLLNDLPPMV